MSLGKLVRSICFACLLLTGSFGNAAAITLQSGATTCPDNYCILLRGTGFDGSTYVDVRALAGAEIIAQYWPSQITLGSEGSLQTLQFAVTTPSLRDLLDAEGLRFYVVSPTAGYQFAGPVQVRRTATNVPPTVSISASPASGVSVGTPVSLTANTFDSDGTVTSVSYSANGQPIGTSTAGPNFPITWQPTTSGTFQIVGIAVDNNGAPATSQALSFSVSAVPSTVIGSGGSNLIWYYIGPESSGCAREDYAIINDYHRQLPSELGGQTKESVRSYVRRLLASMHANGQRRLRLGVYAGAGINTGVLDSEGVATGTVQDFLPGLPSRYLQNLSQFLSDIRDAGFVEVLIAAHWIGQAPFEWTGGYRPDLADAWWQMIQQIHGTASNSKLAFKIDLANEMAPVRSTGSQRDINWNRFARELWLRYVQAFGASTSVGFSFPTNRTSRVANIPNVYGSTRPSVFDFHLYEDIEGLLNFTDIELDRLGLTLTPIIIGESFYNDLPSARAIRATAQQRNRTVLFAVQWPLAPPRSPDDCGQADLVPLEFGNYATEGL